MNMCLISMYAVLSIVPFILLLGMIATGPVLYPSFWHRYYVMIALLLGLGVLGYYVVVMGDVEKPVHAVADYVQFIVLIGTLYMASSGILIDVRHVATPWVNLVFLWSGAVLSNLIGTTGASMLLIRPFIRLNGERVRAYHIVFFIFMVSNVGGSITAFADPPNLIGFFKGVPFLWTVKHNFLPWLLALVLLSVIFFWIDRGEVSKRGGVMAKEVGASGSIRVRGVRNIGWLMVIVMAVFIDPNIFTWVPAIVYHGHRFSFVREVVLLVVGLLSYRYTDRGILEANGFSIEPLKEVVFIFMGIFGTMIPAIELIGQVARSPFGQGAITPNMLYWCTGILSSVLDNAPTYLNFLAAGMASMGLSVHEVGDVGRYADEAIAYLQATSIAAVFFGAMTYVGNGPNFMVRAIAVEQKVEMPSFGGYITRYSLRFLLPVLVIVWLVFFY